MTPITVTAAARNSLSIQMLFIQKNLLNKSLVNWQAMRKLFDNGHIDYVWKGAKIWANSKENGFYVDSNNEKMLELADKEEPKKSSEGLRQEVCS